MKQGDRVIIPHNPGESQWGTVQEPLPNLTGKPLHDDWEDVTVLRDGCDTPETVMYCYISTEEDVAKLQNFIKSKEHNED